MQNYLNAQNVTWRANIVPQQDPTSAECLAAIISLQQFNLNIVMEPPV